MATLGASIYNRKPTCTNLGFVFPSFASRSGWWVYGL
jgi:hypothetical protein